MNENCELKKWPKARNGLWTMDMVGFKADAGIEHSNRSRTVEVNYEWTWTTVVYGHILPSYPRKLRVREILKYPTGINTLIINILF